MAVLRLSFNPIDTLYYPLKEFVVFGVQSIKKENNSDTM